MPFLARRPGCVKAGTNQLRSQRPGIVARLKAEMKRIVESPVTRE
jgi:hypothetical protein